MASDLIERNTHLLDWLADGYTHCQHGTKEWCEAYLHNAKAVIEAQDSHIAELEEGQYAARNLLTLFLCIDFDHFTEHDEALLDSVAEDSRRLLASPLTSEEPQR